MFMYIKGGLTKTYIKGGPIKTHNVNYKQNKSLQNIILIIFITTEGSMTILCETNYQPNVCHGFGDIPHSDGPYFQ